MKIAYFSPLPPARSGIADYSADLLPALAASAEITLFAASPHAVSPAISSQFDVKPISAFPECRWQFDMPVYQMGNSTHHSELYAMMQRFPGIVVLHDYVLAHFMGTQDYRREHAYATGRQAARHSAENFDESLNKRVLDLSLGVIVHSQYAADRIAATHPDLAVTVIQQPMAVPHWSETATLPDDGITRFASIGQITRFKQIDVALTAFERHFARHPGSEYALIGSAGDMDVAELIRRYAGNAAPHVTWYGFIDDLDDVLRRLAQANAVLNLRYPTAGETSAAALRALAVGTPVVVTDIGWYRELPDSVAHKVPVNDPMALTKVMARVADSAENRLALRRTARDYIRRHHTPTAAARQTIAFISIVLDQIDRRFVRPR